MRFRYSPALVTGFGAAVLVTVPFLRSAMCCLLIPAAAALSLFINQKLEGSHDVPASEGISFGLMTGFFAALFATFFEVIVTLAARSNEFTASLPEMEKMLKQLHMAEATEQSIKLLRLIATEIKNSGFSLAYTVILLIGNMASDLLFGMIGGLVGASILNKRNNEQV